MFQRKSVILICPLVTFGEAGALQKFNWGKLRKIYFALR